MQAGEQSFKLENRYQFNSLIGHGGSGEVYAAWDDHLKRTVAIKRMKTKGVDDSVLANPWGEAIRLAAIRQSNIVTVYDMGQDQGVPYIVMEYIQGETLEDRVLQQPFSVAEFGELARQTLDGIIAAHHAGLIHRDIKPSNIMLTPLPSGGFQVKILDFGMAKFLQAPSAQTINIDGTITGSVCWISPEQVNREPVDARSDLYALGCVFYFALSGRRPFDGPNALEILTAHLTHNLTPLETLMPELPPLLAQWVMAMINLRPEHRYQNAIQALAALNSILGYTQALAISSQNTANMAAPVLPHVSMSTALVTPPPVARPSIPLAPPHTTISAQVESHVPDASPVPAETKSGSRGVHWAWVACLAVLLVVTSGALWFTQVHQNLTREASPKAVDSVQKEKTATTPQSPSAVADDPQKISRSEGPATPSAPLEKAVVQTLSFPTPIAPAATATPSPTPPEVATIPAEVVFRVHGSNTIGATLLPALMEEFLKLEGASKIVRKSGTSTEDLTLEMQMPDQNGPRAVEIAAHGSATAFEDLLTGKCDLGMASRPVKEAEAAAIAAAGLGDLHKPSSEHVLGLDGIAILVNKDNQIPDLTREQVAKIFTGEIADWGQVGGTPGPIHLYSRDNKSGTFDTFKSLVLDKAPLAASAKRFEDSAELSDAIAADSNGIGFVGLPFVRDAKPLAVCDPGTAPLVATRFTVATEDYILSRRLFLYSTANSKNPWVRRFVDFALSDAGQEIVHKIGFVKQIPDAQLVSLPPDAPQDYVQAVKGARRLSLNFRFKAGSTQLDNKALRDLDRIGNLLASPDYRGKSLLLLGFADNMGNARTNLRLSNERAQLIARELTTRGIPPTTVAGFGSIMPVASNTDAAGRDKNRRVEVWLR